MRKKLAANDFTQYVITLPCKHRGADDESIFCQSQCSWGVSSRI